jgi:hypothetical protein
MDFTLQDFRDYIERLRKSDLRGDETYKKRMPCNGVTADDYQPNAIGWRAPTGTLIIPLLLIFD